MRKLRVLMAAGAVALAFGTAPAQAAPVSSFFVGGPNQASDENREYLINRTGGATIVDVGDSLRGIVNMNTLNSVGANLGGATPNNEWTAVFQALVVGKVALGGGIFSYLFAPDPAFAANLCGGVGGCVSAFVPGTGAMVVMFEDAVHNLTVDGLAVEAAIATGSDGAFFWTLGFSGPGGTPGVGEGWNAVTLLGLGDDIANAANFSSGTSGGIVNAGLSCLTSGVGNCAQILPTTPSPFGGLVDIALSGSIRGISDLPTTQFQASSNTDVSFNRIPEPGTLGLLGLALAGLGVLSRRRT